MSHLIMIRTATLGVALSLAATAAVAQLPVKPAPKDTMAQHIKIKKEPVVKQAGGDVALPKKVDALVPCDVIQAPPVDVDAIRMEQYRLDSIAASFERNRMLADKERALAALREQTRRDSIAAAEAQALRLKRALARGAYVAIAGGMSAPQRAIRDGYTGGWNVTVPVGYDATDNPLGVRVDASVDHLNGTRVHDAFENTLAASGDLSVWSLNTDAKLRFAPPGLSTRSHVYLLGGIGMHRVTGGVYGTTSDRAGQNVTFANAGTKFGWNAGAGATMQWSGIELFVESRFFEVKSGLGFHTNGGVGTYTSFTPIVVGLNWF